MTDWCWIHANFKDWCFRNHLYQWSYGQVSLWLLTYFFRNQFDENLTKFKHNFLKDMVSIAQEKLMSTRAYKNSKDEYIPPFISILYVENSNISNSEKTIKLKKKNWLLLQPSYYIELKLTTVIGIWTENHRAANGREKKQSKRGWIVNHRMVSIPGEPLGGELAPPELALNNVG